MRRRTLLLLVAACAAPPDPEERVAADRDHVRAALYRQLDHVLARRKQIADEEGEAAAREREELERLAGEIAERIVRTDPDANEDALLRRLEEAR